MIKGMIFLLLLCSCGKTVSPQGEALLLNEHTSQSYDLSYTSLSSRYHFEGTVQIEGAGLHLKLISKNLSSGHLFLMLSKHTQCPAVDEDKLVLWNLNNDFSSQQHFENGFSLAQGRIKKSFDFHLLMKFLTTPKRNYQYIKVGEKLSLEFRTLLFYYSSQTYVKENNLILMGCAQFYST